MVLSNEAQTGCLASARMAGPRPCIDHSVSAAYAARCAVACRVVCGVGCGIAGKGCHLSPFQLRHTVPSSHSATVTISGSPGVAAHRRSDLNNLPTHFHFRFRVHFIFLSITTLAAAGAAGLLCVASLWFAWLGSYVLGWPLSFARCSGCSRCSCSKCFLSCNKTTKK